MQAQKIGKNTAVFVFIFLLLGLITTNLLFYAVGIILGFVVLVDWVSFYFAIRGMGATAIRTISKTTIHQDNFIDVGVMLTLNAKNIKTIYFQDKYPDAFQPVSGDSAMRIDSNKSEHDIIYRLRAIGRGHQSFLESHIHLKSNLGMFKHEIILKNQVDVRINPSVIGSNRSLNIASQYGVGSSKQKGTGMDVLNIRSYMIGDDFRHIDWKTSTRLNKLFIREFEADTGLPLFVLLDHTETEHSNASLNHAVKIASHLTQQAASNDKPVGLIAFTHNGITNQILIKNGKKQFEILNNLTTLTSKKSKPCNEVMDGVEIKRMSKLLMSLDDGEIHSILRPYYTDNSQHSIIMGAQGINQAIQSIMRFSKTPSMIAIITDLSYSVPLIESIRIATYYGNKIILIVLPQILFKKYDLLEFEEQYQEYTEFETKIEKFKRLRNVDIVVAGPGARPEQLVNQVISRWKAHY